jgi:hypothetical protein
MCVGGDAAAGLGRRRDQNSNGWASQHTQVYANPDVNGRTPHASAHHEAPRLIAAVDY